MGRGPVSAGRVSQLISGHAACATVPRSHVRWLGEPPPRRSDRGLAPRGDGAGRRSGEAVEDLDALGGRDSPPGDSRCDLLGGDSPSQPRPARGSAERGAWPEATWLRHGRHPRCLGDSLALGRFLAPYEVGHLAWRYRPASTSAGAAVVLPGNQPPVPAENRVRRDDAGDLRQHPPAEFLASPRESTALGVSQAKWTWAKVLPEDPILLPERIDRVFLVAVHPASGREYEEAQSVGHSLRLLGEQPLAPTLFRRFANLGRFVAPYGVKELFLTD